MNLRVFRDNLILESMGGERSLWVIYKGVRKAGGSHEHAAGGIMALAAYHSPLNSFNEAGITRVLEKFRADFEKDNTPGHNGPTIDAEYKAT